MRAVAKSVGQSVGQTFCRPLRSAVVRANDRRHQRMTHDVDFAEADEFDAGNIGQKALNFDQAALRAMRQIDLRDVAGDHGFAVIAQASQKHLHLFAGGVLGLVQNRERIV